MTSQFQVRRPVKIALAATRALSGASLVAIVAMAGSAATSARASGEPGRESARAAQAIELPVIEVTADTPVAAKSASTAPEPMPGMLEVALRSFAPVSVISRSNIERNLPQSLGEAVADIPGVAATAFAPGASRPVIRGLDNFRVSVQENGVGASGVSALGEDHGVPVNPMTAERIEIIRGPATLRYGSQAIGGVVSLDNNRIPEALPANGVNARLMTGVSSANRGLTTAGEINAGAGNVAVHADFFGQKSGSYATPAGRQANSALNASGAAIGGSVITDSGFIGLAYAHLSSNYQIPGGESAALRSRIEMAEDKLVLKGEHRPGGAWIDAIRFWAGASNYRHRELGLAHDTHDHDHDHHAQHDMHAGHDHDHSHGEDSAVAVGDTLHSTFYNRQQEARVEVQHTTFNSAIGAWSGALGMHVARQKLNATGEGGGLIAPAETRSIAAYAFEELKINDSWRLQFAGRIGGVHVDGSAAHFPGDYIPDGLEPADSPRSRTFAPKSVSAGVQYMLPWWNIAATLNGQYVERAPSAPELFSKGAHHASGTFEIGNANLKVERARTLEFSLKKADGPARFEASVYHTRYSGFIYKRMTGIGCGQSFMSCGHDNELQQIVYSQRAASFTGAEFMGQYDLAPLGDGLFGVEARYDVVRARFDDGSWVPRLPPQRVGGGVYWRSDAVFARVLLTHAFARNDAAEYETRTPGYNNLKAELNYRFKLPANSIGAQEAVLGIVGDNLLNERMRNSVSFKKNEVLMPGRTVRAHVTVKF